MRKIVELKDLVVEIMTTRGIVTAVRGVNLEVEENQIHGIVGESGCGKSMTIKTIMMLHDDKKTAISGKVKFMDKDVLLMNKKELQKIRGKDVAMIFQDPMVALNPIKKVGRQLVEMICEKENISKEEAKKRVIKLFEEVEIAPAIERFEQYPFQLSGGMLQRIVIAMAFCCNPKLLLADEPTTALDVTTQEQILQLIKTMQQKSKMSVIVVTHNLGVVAEICDVVSVMYAGRVVEKATVRQLFDNPVHPYTKALLESSPTNGSRGERMATIEGTPPLLYKPIIGCPFAPRCKIATEDCFNNAPEYKEIELGHIACCSKIKQGE